ncbi:MAG: hypothetical protein MK193_01030 [Lentisphaeria bacterium]|nr:hypothetical protein [Lentisphaeria bacterium]
MYRLFIWIAACIGIVHITTVFFDSNKGVIFAKIKGERPRDKSLIMEYAVLQISKIWTQKHRIKFNEQLIENKDILNIVLCADTPSIYVEINGYRIPELYYTLDADYQWKITYQDHRGERPIRGPVYLKARRVKSDMIYPEYLYFIGTKGSQSFKITIKEFFMDCTASKSEYVKNPMTLSNEPKSDSTSIIMGREEVNNRLINFSKDNIDRKITELLYNNKLRLRNEEKIWYDNHSRIYEKLAREFWRMGKNIEGLSFKYKSSKLSGEFNIRYSEYVLHGRSYNYEYITLKYEFKSDKKIYIYNIDKNDIDIDIVLKEI